MLVLASPRVLEAGANAENIGVCYVTIQKTLGTIVSGAIALLLVLSPCRPASASFIDPHAYVQQEFDHAGMNGAYFNSVNGSDDLQNPNQMAPAAPNGTPPLIDKEMWLSMDSSTVTGCAFGCWIELGDTQGAITNGNTNSNSYTPSQTLWSGHFFAIARQDGSYYEEPIGTQNPPGAHNFEIATFNGGAQWNIYVDAVFLRGITSMASFRQSPNVIVGIENTDTQNNFTSGTSANTMQYLVGQTWTYWDASPYNSDSAWPNGSSAYDGINNVITFNHS